MEKATSKFSQLLIERIYTTNMLKHMSDTLESLSQNKAFKQHAQAIVTDTHLTNNQKRTQLLYLIRTFDSPLLYEFLSDEMTSSHYWLFHTDKIDYFERFVKEFQSAVESVVNVQLATSVPLTAVDLENISSSFSSMLGQHVVINHEVNKAIIGGVQLRLENLVFDYSLRTKFQQFQQQWLSSLEKIDAAVGRNEPPL
jgi:F0F1-type ATP synthase delta subunit